jgi:rod shape-determining protein MreD
VSRLLLPILFGALFIVESLFVQYTPADLFGDGKVSSPHFLLAGIIFLSVFGSKKHGIIYGFVFGALFDIVYTEILGVYLFLFPLTAYFASKTMRVIHANLFTASGVSLIAIALVEIAVYWINLLINVTDLSFVNYLEIRFYPTILLNLAFVILAAFPLKWQFEKFAEELGND